MVFLLRPPSTKIFSFILFPYVVGWVCNKLFVLRCHVRYEMGGIFVLLSLVVRWRVDREMVEGVIIKIVIIGLNVVFNPIRPLNSA